MNRIHKKYICFVDLRQGWSAELAAHVRICLDNISKRGQSTKTLEWECHAFTAGLPLNVRLGAVLSLEGPAASLRGLMKALRFEITKDLTSKSLCIRAYGDI